MLFLIYLVCLGILHKLSGTTDGYMLEVLIGIVVWVFHIIGDNNDKNR